MDPSVSSQFVSALMLVAPFTNKNALTIRFQNKPVSYPYIQMTEALMVNAFGCEHSRGNDQIDTWKNTIRIASKGLSAYSGLIEPDASNASYYFAAACVTRSVVKVTGLPGWGLQGDTDFAGKCLQPMGASVEYNNRSDFIRVRGTQNLIGQDIDLGDMPDMAQTLAVIALFAVGETVIRNVGNLRVKETDRLEALRNELTRLGAKVTIEGDDIHIVPPAGNVLRHSDGTSIDNEHPVIIHTYDDHRMAMSFALAGLRQAGVRIADPKCVNKTYPEFFEHLDKLRVAAGTGAVR